MKRHDESISDRLRRMAATDELGVGRGRAEQIAARALARAQARPHRRARLVAAIVSGSAFAIVSVTGVGAIADQAVPGDSLYPVDRAYESISRVIGRDVDRTQERLEEALALVQRGDREAAANHVNTELGQRSPLIALPEDNVDVSQTVTTAPSTDDAAPVAEATATVEAAPATTPETAPASAEALPAVEDEPDDQSDPFLLALEHALRATQAAADTGDELAAAEADEAVRSVVKLAAGETEDASGTSPEAQAAPGAVSVQTTTTTTTTTTTVAPGNSGAAPGNSTSTTTTTSVPSDDSGEEPPGDGETAGDDSSGSQEGSGSAGEPGDDGDQPPVFLPIP